MTRRIDEYTPRVSRDYLTPEQVDLARRRTMPFLRRGTHYSIERLMREAYLQGIRDALQAMDPTPNQPMIVEGMR